MRRIIIGLWICVCLAGCSAVGLAEQNAQATAVLETAIAGTVASQINASNLDRPQLIYPAQNSEIDLDNAILDWEYQKPLEETQAYRVRVGADGSALEVLDVVDVSQVDVAEWISDHPANVYLWQVEIVTLENGDLSGVVANPSEIGEFSVAGISAIDNPATLSAIVAQATNDAEGLETQIAETVSAILAQTPTPEAEETAEATADAEFVASGARTRVYGTIPIAGDSFDTITALAFDEQGRLLVGLRSGEIYALVDDDQDGDAETATLIFEDLDGEFAQVIGIFAENEVLYIINGSRLSRLDDSDSDGVYDSTTSLTQSLPTALLQANNSLVSSADGRYFMADINTGDILQLILTE